MILICNVKGLDDYGQWSVDYGVRAVSWSTPSVVHNVVGDFDKTKDAFGGVVIVPSEREMDEWINGRSVRSPPATERDPQDVRAENLNFITSCIPKYFDSDNKIAVCSLQVLDEKGNPVAGLPISYVIFSPGAGGEVKLVIGKSMMHEALSKMANFFASRRQQQTVASVSSSPPRDKKRKGLDAK